MATKKITDNQTFEEKLDEINKILNEMNNEKISLDKMMENYTRANKLINECKKTLEEAKNKLDNS